MRPICRILHIHPNLPMFSGEQAERRRTAERVEERAVAETKVLRRRVKDVEKLSREFDNERRAATIYLLRN